VTPRRAQADPLSCPRRASASRSAASILVFSSSWEVHLQTERRVSTHPGAKEDSAQLNWKAMLDDHLPSRYRVAKGFVIDSHGGVSDEIDLVVYDRQYSPLLFNRDGILYVPAESVYAVLEVKQQLDKGTWSTRGRRLLP
jgi:hypothetical protein